MSTRNFALGAGIVYLLVGICGFVPAFVTAPPAHAPHLIVNHSYGYLFGLFPVNVLHNIVHLAIGAWGLASYRKANGPIVFAKGVAIIYALFTVMGLLPFLKITGGLIPLFGHDVWLHALTSFVAGYFGFVRHRIHHRPGGHAV